jgi:hypothetical protein
MSDRKREESKEFDEEIHVLHDKKVIMPKNNLKDTIIMDEDMTNSPD